METELSIRLLGGAEISYGNQPLRLTAVKTRALLFYLVLTRRAHSRDLLAGLLWTDMAEATAKTNLRQAASTLRKLLPHHLHINRYEMSINLDAQLAVDVHVFETAVSKGRASDIAQLKTAADLYNGDLLTGFFVENANPFMAWLLPQRERLHSLALQTYHTLSDHFTRRRRVWRGLHYTSKLLELEPWREESHQQMMRLLGWNGQYEVALAQFNSCRHILQEEIGVAPMPETVMLQKRILAARNQPARALPQPTTPFLGRKEQIEALMQRLSEPDCRLVTIIGMGGVGKTRLALLAAESQKWLYLDGVYFISLADANADTVAPLIAAAVGFTFSGQVPSETQLLDFLRNKEMLLVLDNFEHMLAGATPKASTALSFVITLLQNAPQVKLIVTSRERLNLYEEWLFQIDGLPCPPLGATTAVIESYTSVQLFMKTAERFYQGEWQAKDKEAMVQICGLVGGSPLGLELAAAQTRFYTPPQIYEQLAQNFDVLQRQAHDVPQRHRSIENLLQYSWDLLPLSEQKAYSQLTHFNGGFSSEAAQAVANLSLMMLNALVDKSLLIKDQHTQRYSWHPLLKTFAKNRLEAWPSLNKTAAAAHASYFSGVLWQSIPQLESSRPVQGLAAIDADFDNVKKAWHWMIEQQRFDLLAVSLDATHYYYMLKGLLRDGMAVFKDALDVLQACPQKDASQTRLLYTLMEKYLYYALVRSRNKEGVDIAHEIISNAAVADPQTVVMAYRQLGRALTLLKREVEAARYLEKGLRLSQEIEFTPGEVQILRSFAYLHLYQNQFRRAKTFTEKALTKCNQIPGYDVWLIWRLRGHIASREALHDEAMGYYRQAYTHTQQLSSFTQAVVLVDWAEAELHAAVFDDAQDKLEQALTIYRHLGTRLYEMRATILQAKVLAAKGNATMAKELFHQAAYLAKQIDDSQALATIEQAVSQIE